MCFAWPRALHQLPAGPNLWFWDDPRVWEVNKLSQLCLMDRCVRTHAHTSSPSLTSFFFLFLFLDPNISAPIPHYTQGRAEMRVSDVCLSSSETLAKLSVLSANFTTCDKLKAVMWKRCLPLFFPFLSSPFFPFSRLHPGFCLFHSSDLLHPLLFPLYSPCVSSTFLKNVYVWGRLRGSEVLDAHEWGWLRLLSAVHIDGLQTAWWTPLKAF